MWPLAVSCIANPLGAPSPSPTSAHWHTPSLFTPPPLQALGREERSLAHLLRRYCGVVQDKSHQAADWRLRPLAPQLRQYARSDVHWLLHLAGLMVGEMQARSPSNTGVSDTPVCVIHGSSSCILFNVALALGDFPHPVALLNHLQGLFL